MLILVASVPVLMVKSSYTKESGVAPSTALTKANTLPINVSKWAVVKLLELISISTFTARVKVLKSIVSGSPKSVAATKSKFKATALLSSVMSVIQV